MSEIKNILSKYKSIAMVGVSKDPKKTSTIVMKYMQDYGFKVYPVNPSAKGEKILGEEVYAKVTDINKNVEIVDVFRPGRLIVGSAGLLVCSVIYLKRGSKKNFLILLGKMQDIFIQQGQEMIRFW